MSAEVNPVVLRYLMRDFQSAKPEPFGNEEMESILKFQRQRVMRPLISIGSGTCGRISGSGKLQTLVKEYLDLYQTPADIVEVGCLGLCSAEPILDVQMPGKTRVSFQKVNYDNLTDILDGIFNNTITIEHVLGQHRDINLEPWAQVPFIDELRFFKNQQRIVLSNCGIIDPMSIEEYIAHGGYRSFLKTIFTYRPEKVCDIITESGLRGRGGSGFSTGTKWKLALNTAADQKYLVCNADESDPGAFMDRAIMEGDPHKVLEGIAIAAYAIGASKAYIFVKQDYQLAIQRMENAITQAKAYGLIANDIHGSGVGFNVVIRTAPGAFVLGEETALIACLEGKRGMPASKPPFPAEKGLMQKPTIVNNLETLANVPVILEKGPLWFQSLGSELCKGTKVFSLSGKTNNIGLVEVAMGTPIKEVIYNIGEGIVDNRPLKAIHLGGPSGTSLCDLHLNVPLEFESLAAVGATLGSGGFVVLDDATCMLDLARFYAEFLQKESCGKCIPCREGTRRMTEILTSITRRPSHETTHETLERFKGVMQLEDLAEVIKDTSLCGLGKNASNPILSILKQFREEVEEHIFDRKCRAGVCKELRTFFIDIQRCTGCTACARKCPVNAIIGTPTHPHFIVEDKCTGCGLCYDTCKFVAVVVR